jgi:hypothetical protein
VTNINKHLDTFLGKLYESNLQVASSDPANNDSQASPLKFTVPAKYQRYVEKLYNPLSGHRYSLQRTTSSGEVERMQMTVHDRLRSFENTISAETEEIKNLQLQWEGVVADIFQLGMACLGEENIASLLSTAGPDGGEAESTLFVPEQSDSAHKAMGKRKRVSKEASPGIASATGRRGAATRAGHRGFGKAARGRVAAVGYGASGLVEEEAETDSTSLRARLSSWTLYTSLRADIA